MQDARTEAIRARAYELWEQEGRPEGRDQDHWFRAAQEIAQSQDASSGGGDRLPDPDLPGSPGTASNGFESAVPDNLSRRRETQKTRL
ncbi:DUF2934 domain-containing protein [Pelagibacterium xiamenense]|uniref:DUF2934 domain-containing protein n=1 Tax=Pelagibacterium xiamenense TaxID=2901140 RepID=UPI001E3A4FEA|nr:DUF2934 domain-containing protein [Pelagibacterium xiamenense]MCD7058653.1 DUF2934 domain-containing protein [Pelagibacterium xiamenense]